LALDLTNKLLEIFPAHPRAVGNKEYYEDELQKGVTDKRKGDDGAAVADTDPVV
jgi:prolyl 4-hydroxylase